MSANIRYRPFRPDYGFDFPAGAPESFWKMLCMVTGIEENNAMGADTIVLTRSHLSALKALQMAANKQTRSELQPVIDAINEYSDIELWREY